MRERVFVSTRQRVLDLLGAGRTVAEVALELGIAANTVRYHRDRQPVAPVPTSDLRYTVSQVTTRESVATLLDQGVSKAEIARRLNITKATVSYHARRLGHPVDARGARRYDWAAVQAYYECGFTKSECEQAFGFSSHSWHEAVKRGDIVPRPGRIPDHELFVDGPPRCRKLLKRRLLDSGVREAVCALCALRTWRGRPLSLALHHVNGRRNDNRVENLQLLCPNCHSQTENFAGRNGRVRTRDLPGSTPR